MTTTNCYESDVGFITMTKSSYDVSVRSTHCLIAGNTPVARLFNLYFVNQYWASQTSVSSVPRYDIKRKKNNTIFLKAISELKILAI